MPEEAPQPDPPLKPEQEVRISELKKDDMNNIDQALLSNIFIKWQKMSRVVNAAMGEMPNELNDIPDIFFAQRLRYFVAKGKIEYRGNLAYMRYCEVKLTSIQGAHET
jgi:hypothetical protein